MRKTLAATLLAAVAAAGGAARAQVAPVPPAGEGPPAGPPVAGSLDPARPVFVTTAAQLASDNLAPRAAPAGAWPAGAGPAAAPAGPVTPLYADAAVEEPTKKIAGALDVTVTTKYIARGLILNNNSFIAQPSGRLDFNAFEDKAGPVNKVAPFIGVWSDLTDHNRFATTSLRDWYEFDWTAGVAVTFLDAWKLSAQYLELISPSNSFHNTSKNVVFTLSYDDSKLWAGNGTNSNVAFSINPAVDLWLETGGASGSGLGKGQLVQPAVTPQLTFGAGSGFPVTVGFPVRVGLGFNNYYGGAVASRNQFYGYLTAGVEVSLPIHAVDAAVGGHWTGHAGAAYYNYGSGTHAFNVRNVGYTSRNDVIGTIGMTCTF